MDSYANNKYTVNRVVIFLSTKAKSKHLSSVIIRRLLVRILKNINKMNSRKLNNLLYTLRFNETRHRPINFFV